MLHTIVKREKMPTIIRIEPRLFSNHTTDVIFSVFWYVFSKVTRMKNQLAMPAVAPKPHTMLYLKLYSIR